MVSSSTVTGTGSAATRPFLLGRFPSLGGEKRPLAVARPMALISGLPETRTDGSAKGSYSRGEMLSGFPRPAVDVRLRIQGVTTLNNEYAPPSENSSHTCGSSTLLYTRVEADAVLTCARGGTSRFELSESD